MSTYSPSFSPDFGCFILRRKDPLDVTRTSFHVKSDDREKAWSSEARISPRRVEPKKATVDAAQMTCFERGSQSVLAILSPIVRNKENVTTLRVGEEGFESE
jgi:hypothetical protein